MPDLSPGAVVRLSSRVRRVVAPNGGEMTGPGTNSYIVGQQQLALIDPGPAYPEHIRTLRDAVGDRLRWILVTHTHLDHSPAATPLAQATGARLIGRVSGDTLFQDRSFKPDWQLEHDTLLRTEEYTLRAVYTPGHVDNHYCLLLEEEQLLFTGDHIINGSTVVIVPPGGDMSDYLASLRRLHNYPLQQLAPGHGDLMEHPRAVVDGIIAHRLQREKKVRAALQSTPHATLDDLLPIVYAGLAATLLPVARLSLHAHLIKLRKDGHATQEGEHWRPTTGAKTP